MRKTNEFFLFQRDAYTEKDYEMYCEDFEIEYDEDNIYAFYEWVAGQEEMDFDDMLSNFKYSHLKNTPVLIEGSVGTWSGRFEVEQVKCNNFVDAIYKCMGRSCEISEVVKRGNAIEVTAIHHDGRNYFTLYFLTPLGEDRFDRRDMISTRNRENILKLPKYMWE